MRILIVDDEPLARRRLLRLLAPFDDVEVVGEAADGAEAIRMASELTPDVLLLDIDMPVIDGLAVAEHPAVPSVIFTTAHRGHALEAFEADAIDYLVKPVSRERLARALEKARERRPSASAPGAQSEARSVPEGDEAWRIVVAEGSVKHLADAREVDRFLADSKYLSFRWRGEELLLRESLDKLEARLAPFGFLRVNRGALVRRAAVAAYDAADGGSVVLTSGERLPVSRRAARAVKAALGIAPSASEP